MLKRILIIIIFVITLLISGFMTTYDLSHAITTKTSITHSSIFSSEDEF